MVVVSAFGRGNWLAAELASAGMAVTLVDTSDQFGRWAPEDWEGPFGYFHTERLLASQRERLIEEDYIEDLPEGLTIWLPEGPIDFRSPLSPHLLAQSGVSSEAIQFLTEYESLGADKIRSMREKIRRRPFSETWLVHLACQLASHVYMDNAESVTYGRPLPLFAPWQLRRVSRKGVGHSLDWVMSKGVKVHIGAELVDLSLESGEVNSIEIRSLWSGAISGRQFVWMLSGEETDKLSPRIAELLYPRGVVRASWNWVRYRVRVAKEMYLENLPLKWVMIGDVYAPWTHDNLMIVQRTVQPEDLDVWIRIPSQHRFQRAYLESRGQDILQLLSQRIPNCSAAVSDMPQDYFYEYQEIGPSRFPLYLERDLGQMVRAKYSNLVYSSVEDWTLLEWSSLLRDQLNVSTRLLNWKKELDARASGTASLNSP